MLTELPSCCALIAAIAARALERGGIPTRLLAIVYRLRPKHRHIVCCFLFDGRLRVYDEEGALTLAKDLHFESDPTKIARDWSKRLPATHRFRVISAEWY